MRMLVMVAWLSACGGGGSSDDLSVPDDLSPSSDMATVPDLAVAPNGATTGQLTLTDVAGTFYRPGASLPNAHVLLALASLPSVSGVSQYTDPGYNTAPGSLHGCTANRYDETTDAGAHPSPSANAGPVTLYGYDSMHLQALDANGTSAMPPDKIVCVNPTATSYNCYYGNAPTDGSGSIAGDSTNTVLFPTFDKTMTPPGFPCDETGHPGTCEQHPIPLGGGANILEDIAGGGEYGPVPMRQISSVPDGISITSIAGGGATAAASKNLDDVVPDPTQDLVITWSCPDAGGCPINFVDVLAGLVVTSQRTRDSFDFTSQYGQAECIEQTSAGKVTLRKEAIARILGTPKQSGGSVLFVLTRLRINLAGTNGHTVYLTAGHGVYGFATLP